jgi:hypothetical protein
MQSVPVTTDVASSNLDLGEVYNKGSDLISLKFFSDLRQVGGFSPGTPVSSTNKTCHHNITEILLKVALKTITLTLTHLTL